ncbi:MULTISPECIES: glycosyltransferase [unclassified Thioalkalivibrio]|uniref:glycosyltransferase n=1 Tax=unclassified Thioalkalivibrio TaxID=2621013 RepID=UPI000360537A|nr:MULTISPECIES: glycosyltransferase [unclassified Thioalkalivibrio]
MNDRTAVIILGMHRSGTSALSRVLNLQGADIARNLLPPSENNRTGFWESRDLVELQDEVLNRLGQRWQSLHSLPDRWWEREDIRELRARLRDYLEQDFADSNLFVMKDPRMCRLMPLWEAVLSDFGARARVVIMLRHPAEVARSLEARRDMEVPYGVGLRLWERYMLEAERSTRHLSRCFVSYDDLLADWQQTVSDIAKRLGIAWPRSLSESCPEVEAFLSEGHRHQRVLDDSGIPASVARLFQSLGALTGQPDEDAENQLQARAAASAGELEAASGLLESYDHWHWQSELRRRALVDQLREAESARSRMQRELDSVRARLQALGEQHNETRKRLNDQSAQLRLSHRERQRLQAEKDALMRSLSWRVTGPLRRLERLGRRTAYARHLRELRQIGVKPTEFDTYERLRDSGLFDRDYYLEQYSQVRESGLDPLLHYLRHGVSEGLKPNPWFDTSWYIRRYPDVAAARTHPLLHFVQHGATEGRNPGPGFNTLRYFSRHPEVSGSGLNPLAHYMAHGGGRANGSVGEDAADSEPAWSGPGGAPAGAYQDFSGFDRLSIFTLTLDAPFSEEDRRVLGHMSGVQKHLAMRFEQTPSTALVSIVMPTHNRASCIAAAISSALAQSHERFELVIVDDGSTDATESVVRGFDDERIRYFRMERNRGAAVARNLGLEKARGKFVTYLDTDNTMEPDFVRILLGVLESEPEFDMVYCAQSLLRGTGEGAIQEGVRFAQFSRSLLENRNFIDLGAILHRRELTERIGGFNESMRRLMDWEFLLRATEARAPKPVPCVLSTYFHDAAENQITRERPFFEALTFVDEYLAQARLSDLLGPVGVDGVERMYPPRHRPQVDAPAPVSIVVPSYGCLDYLKVCVEAVHRFTESPFELIVVDNASADDVRDYLRGQAEAGRLRLIQNDNNLGFTYAVNQGIELAAPENDVILLNNDAVVTPGWAVALQAAMRDVPNAGLIVPRQVLLPGTKTIDVHNPVMDASREADVNLSLHHDNVLQAGLGHAKGYFGLSFAPFFAVYIPRDTISTIGPLDHENGPHYRSDRLYCEAVRQIADRAIVYTPHSKVYHFLQKATTDLKSADPEGYQTLFVRNEWSEVSGQ